MNDEVEQKAEELERKAKKLWANKTRRRNIIIGVVAAVVLTVIAVAAFREDLPNIPVPYRGE